MRYSTPPGLVGAEVWVRAAGDELVLVADLGGLALRPGLAVCCWCPVVVCVVVAVSSRREWACSSPIAYALPPFLVYR